MTSTIKPGEHVWTYDEGDPEFDIPDSEPYCMYCYHWRNWDLREDEEPPCQRRYVCSGIKVTRDD